MQCKKWSMRALCVLFLGLVSIYATADSLSIKPRLDVDYQPEKHTDEGGFWYKVEQLEFETKRSPYRINDADINAYLSEIVCALAREYCTNIRVYLIDNPHFNASMYPNGMMHVNTGLLLRVENEAQLAAILGHEIGHYLMTHQLIRYRNARDGRAFAAFLDIGLVALTGVYGVASLTMEGANLGFSRDHEYEADILGVEMMSIAGYSPHEAAKVWEHVIEEREADQSKETSSIFWATHPPSDSRANKLRQSATALEQKYAKATDNHQARFVAMVNRIYAKVMANHISLQEYEQSELLLAKHSRLGFAPELTHFFTGELLRMRAKEGDLDKAVLAYKEAAKSEHCLPETHKQLGYLLLKKDNHKEALHHFQQYLDVQPDASDRAMIEYYLNTLR